MKYISKHVGGGSLNERKHWVAFVSDLGVLSHNFILELSPMLTCPQLCFLRINRTLMEMPAHLSKEIDEHFTIILIISLQKEMKGRSHWLNVSCHS